MAVWEARRQVTAAKWGNIISECSWTWWTAQDVYYWLANSFQYSANINTDDEMHGIKLSTRAVYLPNRYKKCQLVSLGNDGVMALPVDTSTPYDTVSLKKFQFNGFYDSYWEELPDSQKWTEINNDAGTTYSYKYKAVPWVVFQDRFWFGYNTADWTTENPQKWYMASVSCQSTEHANVYQEDYLPFDHPDYTDESIETATHDTEYMKWNITAILNYNNTRLVVAAWQDIWVYYPELDRDHTDADAKYDWKFWTRGWKKVLHYEAWVTIVALTCTFEYLKVWAVDEWWNTKVYYYQGNNNLRSTFVYNLVDLTWVRVLHVYSINWVDYYTSSIAEYASDALVDFNKMVGATPVKLFSQRAGMTEFDVNNKAPYFVWPTSISWAYNDGHIYVADAFGVFSFRYNPQWYDKWYMKRQLRESIVPNQQVYWLCENKGILYVSDSTWCWAMRLYDTWYDGYQPKGILISREFEWKEWGTITKMLDEIRLNFELNPLTDENGEIHVFVSPNNLWKDTYPDGDASDNWYHVMTIRQSSAWTRTEKSNLLNAMWPNWDSAFKFDWQTITYAIMIYRWWEERATPIVRQLDIKYHCKDKTNNVYDIN